MISKTTGYLCLATMSLDGLEEEPLVLSADEMERMSPSKNSLSSSIDFISSALKRMGISDSLNLLSNDPQHVVETCNAIYGLLLQHEKDIEYKETLKKGKLQATQADVFDRGCFSVCFLSVFLICPWLELLSCRSSRVETTASN